MQPIMFAVLALVTLVTTFTVASPVNHHDQSISASAQWVDRALGRDVQLNQSIPASAQWVSSTTRARDDADLIPGSDMDDSWQWWIDFMASRGCEGHPVRIDCVAARPSGMDDNDDDMHAGRVVSPPFDAANEQCHKDAAEKYGDVTELDVDDFGQMQHEIFDCMFPRSPSSETVSRREAAREARKGRCGKIFLENAWNRTQRDLVTEDEVNPIIWWVVLVVCLKQEPDGPLGLPGVQPMGGPFEAGPPGGQKCVESCVQDWIGNLSSKNDSDAFISAILTCIYHLPANSTTWANSTNGVDSAPRANSTSAGGYRTDNRTGPAGFNTTWEDINFYNGTGDVCSQSNITAGIEPYNHTAWGLHLNTTAEKKECAERKYAELQDNKDGHSPSSGE